MKCHIEEEEEEAWKGKGQKVKEEAEEKKEGNFSSHCISMIIDKVSERKDIVEVWIRNGYICLLFFVPVECCYFL